MSESLRLAGLALLALASVASARNATRTRITELVTLPGFAGNSVVQVRFENASTLSAGGGTCAHPSTLETYFFLEVGDTPFYKTHMAMLLTAMQAGTPVTLVGAGTCHATVEMLGSVSVSP